MAAELHRTLGDEPAVLLGERALWLPAHAALLIADLHLGKADVFAAPASPCRAAAPTATCSGCSGSSPTPAVRSCGFWATCCTGR